jgi:predicted MFS family arabinose efflux permease
MFATAYADSLTLVVLLRLLLGVAEAAFFVSSIAALMDLAPPSRIGEAISYNSLGLYLGLAFGPPLGELLVRMAGFGAAWYGAAALSLIAGIVAAGITNLRSGAPAPAGRMQLIYWRAVPRHSGSSPRWSLWERSSPSAHCNPPRWDYAGERAAVRLRPGGSSRQIVARSSS